MFWPQLQSHGWEHDNLFRLHAVSEFDGKKRSCRKRLSHHNARRRKSQGVFPLNPERVVYGKHRHHSLLTYTMFSSFDGNVNVKCLLLQIKSLHGVPLMIQSLHRWKLALPWASREAMALRRSSCLLVPITLYLRIKPQQGRTSFILVFCTSSLIFLIYMGLVDNL